MTFDVTAQHNLIARLKERFPDVAQSGVVTRSQLMEVTSYIPAWLNNAKVGRGLYALPGKATSTTATDLTVSCDMKPMVPVKDPNFVPFGNFNDVEVIVKSGQFYPIFISGPTGNGKSSMVEQICAKHNRPLIRVNLNIMSDEEQLIGTKTLKDGNVEVVEGPVLIAMRKGAIILLDEIDAGGANTLLCLQPILEGKPYYFKLSNEIIHPAPGFNIITTANTKGKGSEDGRYVGTNVLNEAFLERFANTFEQSYPEPKTELKIISKLMMSMNCYDKDFAETLIKWAEAIRKTFDDGGCDENITTRRMTHIVRTFAMFNNKRKAVELCCNRFDASTKAGFLDLFEKVSKPAIPSPPTAAAVPTAEEVPF